MPLNFKSIFGPTRNKIIITLILFFILLILYLYPRSIGKYIEIYDDSYWDSYWAYHDSLVSEYSKCCKDNLNIDKGCFKSKINNCELLKIRIETQMLDDPSYYILVVSVLEMNKSNVSLRTSKLEILEVLRTDMGRRKDEVGLEIINAEWRPSDKPTISYPEVGDKLIVFALLYYDYQTKPLKKILLVDDRFIKYPDEAKELVLNNMTTARTGFVQDAAFYSILLSPLMGIVLYILSLLSTLKTKQTLRIIIFFIPLFVLTMYLFYESGISLYMNIRVDLIFIYPALVLSFIFWPILLIHYIISKSKNKDVKYKNN